MWAKNPLKPSKLPANKSTIFPRETAVLETPIGILNCVRRCIWKVSFGTWTRCVLAGVQQENPGSLHHHHHHHHHQQQQQQDETTLSLKTIVNQQKTQKTEFVEKETCIPIFLVLDSMIYNCFFKMHICCVIVLQLNTMNKKKNGGGGAIIVAPRKLCQILMFLGDGQFP